MAMHLIAINYMMINTWRYLLGDNHMGIKHILINIWRCSFNQVLMQDDRERNTRICLDTNNQGCSDLGGESRWSETYDGYMVAYPFCGGITPFCCLLIPLRIPMRSSIDNVDKIVVPCVRLILCLLQAQMRSLECAFLALFKFPIKLGHWLRLVWTKSLSLVVWVATSFLRPS